MKRACIQYCMCHASGGHVKVIWLCVEIHEQNNFIHLWQRATFEPRPCSLNWIVVPHTHNHTVSALLVKVVFLLLFVSPIFTRNFTSNIPINQNMCFSYCKMSLNWNFSCFKDSSEYTSDIKLLKNWDPGLRLAGSHFFLGMIENVFRANWCPCDKEDFIYNFSRFLFWNINWKIPN